MEKESRKERKMAVVAVEAGVKLHTQSMACACIDVRARFDYGSSCECI